VGVIPVDIVGACAPILTGERDESRHGGGITEKSDPLDGFASRILTSRAIASE
jgi:hypothetical protein